MNRLERDGTAEPVSRDQVLRHARDQGNVHFPCSADHEQRIGNLTRSIHTLLYVMTIHTYTYIHIARKKQIKTTAKRQNKTKSHMQLLQIHEPRAGTARWIGVGPRVTRRYRYPVLPPPFSNPRCHMPTFFAAGLLSRPSLTQLRLRPTSARDRPEGLEIFLGAVSPRRCRSTFSLGPLHHQPPEHISL